MFGLFARPEKGGVSIERAGEILMLADLEGGTNFFDQNDPNAGRNAIIDVLSEARTRGDLINYIRNNREEQARREQEAQYNAYAQHIMDEYHMTPDEYEAYERLSEEAANYNKDNTEIVGWYTLDNRNLERIKRQANKNGGELIMLSSMDKVESLPTPLNGLSFVGNITNNSANNQRNGVINNGIDEYEKPKNVAKNLIVEDGTTLFQKAEKTNSPLYKERVLRDALTILYANPVLKLSTMQRKGKGCWTRRMGR